MAAGLAGNVDRARGELGAVLRAGPTCPPRSAPRWPGTPKAAPRPICCSSPRCSPSCWRSAGSPSAWWDGCSPASGVGSTAARATASGWMPGSLVIRLVLDLLLLAVFVATVFAGFLALYEGHEATRELIVSALLAIIQVRLAILIARVLLAPHTPAQRLLPFDDAAARVLYRGLVTLAWLYGFGDVLNFFLQRFGVPREPLLLVTTLFRLAVRRDLPAPGVARPGPDRREDPRRRAEHVPPVAGRPLAGPDDGLRPVPPGGPDGRAAGRPPPHGPGGDLEPAGRHRACRWSTWRSAGC